MMYFKYELSSFQMRSLKKWVKKHNKYRGHIIIYLSVRGIQIHKTIAHQGEDYIVPLEYRQQLLLLIEEKLSSLKIITYNPIGWYDRAYNINNI